MPSALGCRQRLEAIRHWKRQVPDSDEQRAGKTRAPRGKGEVALGQVYAIMGLHNENG